MKMPVLSQRKDYKTGDAVTAAVINDTIDTAIEAHGKAVTALTEAVLAESNAQAAFAKAVAVEARADGGEFGAAATVEADGLYGFQIINGDLILHYSGSSAPDLSINGDGDLVYNF
jgi:hypothetical protein